ncbi:hypothetical protein V495_05404 [Pseudogymnoascus sp. VKM F-4514 (FW-929)]|nr:hypothetical protein V490_01498 [Pseudogymnoascus sp. VKM F-3557]KFY40531.1 hypothetical protein V495_05404 [Pseudogymnoascus sp. VKM F-4514 (FW-929)]KFY56778.1 hypothetical protein V497_05990 [Pseudogymnoascus sp. VKM F-4516 (FW-969)]
MPPQIPLLARFGALSLCARPAVKPAVAGPVSKISVANASTAKRRHRDPYALAQARQRKAANVKRRDELNAEREAALGDPVRGIPTPFVESFKTATPIEGVDRNQTKHLNYFVKPTEVETALQHSFILTQPVISTNRDIVDPERESEEIRKHAEGHERATAAVQRILALENGNQKDRTRANIRRCVDTFGRHNTDGVLRPRAAGAADSKAEVEKTPRAGPDTGSSEVQIAILTAKIKVLADHMVLKGRQKDKVNKRNLRLLVHRRQKLLQYLRRKERGGDRWQNLISTLGLTEGTWKGEISL